MLLTSIIVLIFIGIVLLVLEILVLPGLIAGIIGGILIISGIAWMYASYGNNAGNITALVTAIATGASIYFSLRSRAWERFGLKDSLEGKTNEVNKLEIHEGDEGISVSALRPMGTVMVNNQRVEAQTNGELLPENSKIVVKKILSNKILVQLAP